MKTYRIRWQRIDSGESLVDANSEEEARESAIKDKDRGFENFTDTYGDVAAPWRIVEVEEVEE